MLRRIGLWVSDERPDLPEPGALVDATWDADEREDVASYLGSGTVARAYLGFSTCRVCGFSRNGNLEFTDGVFLWPQGLAHYVSEHSVRLPPDIIEHARERLQEIQSAIVDEGWWREATSM